MPLGIIERISELAKIHLPEKLGRHPSLEVGSFDEFLEQLTQRKITSVHGHSFDRYDETKGSTQYGIRLIGQTDTGGTVSLEEIHQVTGQMQPAVTEGLRLQEFITLDSRLLIVDKYCPQVTTFIYRENDVMPYGERVALRIEAMRLRITPYPPTKM